MNSLRLNMIKGFLTFGYIGYFPVAPGTIGSLAGVVISYTLYNSLPYYASQGIIFLSIILFTLLGAHLSRKFNQELFNKEDPGQVVIDEVVGVMLATSLPNLVLDKNVDWIYFLVAFVLFRFFDISKIAGIKKLEKIPNGWGVMLDDVLAGIWVFLILNVYKLFPFKNILD